MPFKVLIINETASFCTDLSLMVSAAGYTPACVSGLKEVLEVSRRLQPNCIIIELSRPGIGDMELVQRLQRAPETKHVPLVVVSDCPELEFELLNVFDFLTMPVDVQRLHEDLAVIARGGRKPAPLAIPESLSPEDYRLYYDFLLNHSGLHFEHRNQKLLERGLKSRMTALKLGSYRAYYDYLVEHQESRQELQKLLQHLTIGETYFFRYSAHFDALRKLLPTLVAEKGRDIRLWSAGCSTGEEPYSMAMTVMDTVPDWRERQISILATDINNQSLRRAREGVYKQWSMRVIEQNHLARYFHRVGERYRIRDEVKEMVRFSHLNLQTAEVPEGEFRDIDVIFCRNVMIYFSIPTTRQIVEKFARGLAPGGFLFLGHAETLAYVSTQFDRTSHGSAFYYRKRAAGAKQEAKPARDVKPPAAPRPPVPEARKTPPEPPPRRVLPAAPPVPAVPPPPDLGEMYRRAQDLFDREKYAEAEKLLKEILRIRPDHQEALVTRGFILANQARFREALATCDQVISLNDLLPEAYFLRGMVFDAQEECQSAVEEYRKALLLRMEFIMAHYHLGRLLVRSGKEKEGARELRNTLRLLEKEKQETVIPHSGGLSREAFLEQLGTELLQMS